MTPLALLLALAAAEPARRPPVSPPAERGVALGLFSMDPSFRYRELLEEVRALGATHVSLTWVWWQDDARAAVIAPVPGWSATDEQVIEAMQDAQALGLHVTAFPILRLSRPGPREWRGNIAPADLDAWWESYDGFILHAAALARRGGAARLAVGSELLSREHERARWARLIDRVRLRTPELEVLYSANWDHYEHVAFWDLVDVVGLTGYWELTRDPGASIGDLAIAWTQVRRSVLDFSRRLGRPFVFAEVGYPSIDGGAVWPWNEVRKAPIDLEEQRRAYVAFVRAWDGVPELRGVFWWNWFGFGGADDATYSPRRKPAAEVVREWFAAPAQRGSGRDSNTSRIRGEVWTGSRE